MSAGPMMTDYGHSLSQRTLQGLISPRTVQWPQSIHLQALATCFHNSREASGKCRLMPGDPDYRSQIGALKGSFFLTASTIDSAFFSPLAVSEYSFSCFPGMGIDMMKPLRFSRCISESSQLYLIGLPSSFERDITCS